MQRHGLGEIVAAVVGKGPQIQRRARDRITHRGAPGKMNPHGNWLGKVQVLNFMTSGKQQGLKPGLSKVNGLGLTGYSPEGTALFLERRQANNPQTYSLDTVI